MLGVQLRLKRLFPEGTNVIVLPLDHGEFMGPRRGLIDPLQTLRALGGYDSALLSPGMFIHCQEVFARPGAPQAVVRLNWNADYCTQWGYEGGIHGRVLSPTGALALGADAGLASLAIGTGNPAVDTASVEIFAQLAEEARAAGLPLGGEIYPGEPERWSADEFHDLILKGARIVTELGADFVKCFFTGPRFAEVVAATPAPILVLGAQKTDEAAALRKAADGIGAGARGVVFGRNVFESERPQDFLHALGDVVRRGLPAEAAARAHGFG